LKSTIKDAKRILSENLNPGDEDYTSDDSCSHESNDTDDDISDSLQFYVRLLMDLVPSMERVFNQTVKEKQSEFRQHSFASSAKVGVIQPLSQPGTLQKSYQIPKKNQGESKKRSKRQPILKEPFKRKERFKRYVSLWSRAEAAMAKERIVQGATIFVQKLNAAVEEARSWNTLSLPPQIAVSVKRASTISLCSSLLTPGS